MGGCHHPPHPASIQSGFVRNPRSSGLRSRSVARIADIARKKKRNLKPEAACDSIVRERRMQTEAGEGNG